MLDGNVQLVGAGPLLDGHYHQVLQSFTPNDDEPYYIEGARSQRYKDYRRGHRETILSTQVLLLHKHKPSFSTRLESGRDSTCHSAISFAGVSGRDSQWHGTEHSDRSNTLKSHPTTEESSSERDSNKYCREFPVNPHFEFFETNNNNENPQKTCVYLLHYRKYTPTYNGDTHLPQYDSHPKIEEKDDDTSTKQQQQKMHILRIQPPERRPHIFLPDI
jgi:hypothetical protein